MLILPPKLSFNMSTSLHHHCTMGSNPSHLLLALLDSSQLYSLLSSWPPINNPFYGAVGVVLVKHRPDQVSFAFRVICKSLLVVPYDSASSGLQSHLRLLLSSMPSTFQLPLNQPNSQITLKSLHMWFPVFARLAFSQVQSFACLTIVISSD